MPNAGHPTVIVLAAGRGQRFRHGQSPCASGLATSATGALPRQLHEGAPVKVCFVMQASAQKILFGLGAELLALAQQKYRTIFQAGSALRTLLERRHS